VYQFTEKFDTLLPRPGAGKRILKSKLLTALGATGVLLPYPDNTERLIERKILLQNAFNTTGGSGGGPTPPPAICTTGTTVVADWVVRVGNNGGAAPSAATQTALKDFVCGCVADGTWTKLKAVNVFVPDNLIACITPLLVGTGSDPWGNEGGNFVGGDLTVNGLTGNASNKTLTTTIHLSTFIPVNTGGFAWYCYNAANNGVSLGVYDEVKGMFGISAIGGTTQVANGNTNAQPPAGDLIVVNPNVGNGYFASVRTGATDNRVFFANSTNPHAQVGVTDTHSWTGPFSVFGTGFQIFALQDTLGAEQLFSSDTISFVAFYQDFTATDSANLYTRVQALRVTLGGGFR
jgi:hypothetical protein